MSRLQTWTDERVELVRRLAAQGLSDSQIGAEIGEKLSAVVGIRWRKKIPSAWVQRTPVAETPPSDFAEIGPTLSINGAARYYGTHHRTATAWYKLLDITPAAGPRPGPRPIPQPVVRVWKKPAGHALQLPMPQRENTRAGTAQLHLQRFFPVYRANVQNPSAPNDLWIVAGQRMSEADMIALAERKGMAA